MTVDIEDETDIEHIAIRLGGRDQQVGFAVLLRHCDSTREPARLGRVASVLSFAIENDPRLNEEVRTAAQETLKQWRKAAGRLHEKSLNQLVRDKLASDEDMAILAFNEQHSPAQLLSIYDYGDLLHWDPRHRDLIAEWEQDDFRAGDRRLAFLAAACALAHLYIGFAVLAARAIGRAT